MRILLVKMSSMGDIFHTFPAISDIKKQFPNAEIDWVVEDSFKEIVQWHPQVRQAIPIHLRRWMKQRDKQSWQEFKAWRKALRAENYDYIIDAQGLLKSAIVAKCAQGKGIDGYDKHSAREGITHWFYKRPHEVDKNQHAVERTRQLVGKALGYIPEPKLNFGINQNFTHIQKNPRKLIFIIGTSWVTKLWATSEWQTLTRTAVDAGFAVEIIWGSAEEQAIADQIINACPQATRPMQRLSITTIAEKLVEAAGVVGLDTGFSHLAGALETPTIALYGATSPLKVGLIGDHTRNLQLSEALDCMPCHKRHCKWLPENSQDTPQCMADIKATQVWAELQKKIAHY
ncbi:lipopolysaccharide heptosyltransferase I [Cellvibrio sp. PSBB023]|uniref:lipopolysaccharide heptosyltransferase I n=1 Tax=Cellvibrio sp. PSBB023 TaxID=1945512 RepID=UPI00098F9F3A|nr:lipopolysaccharide heptosyltransferase I [Cellvibrio sp. PSBB023]AQT58994.1 lipopolysaccharide heptosyltransferase I [Cellvibrio sp. PSBB023]